MYYLKYSFILIIFALYISACNDNAKNSTALDNTVTNSNSSLTAQPNATIDELAAGREAYAISCSNCHKEDGSGGKIEIDGKTFNADNLLTDKMKKMSDEKYISYIENGIPDEGMPAFKDKLTDQQIKEVVKYIRRELQKN
ncbi:MAG TPA: cytochrome c [Pyrinomonadaceae bacterium]|jgi:mono/diheme cytochrome c family protein